MSNKEFIYTVEKFNEYKFKEKSSEFIGQIFHVKTEEEAEKILKKVKKEYYDARHHCYAFQLFDASFRYSDDGEPNGTAGIRIHNAIKHFKLTNVIIISIRYFGGTKLGVGPLGKAYYNSAFNTIETAKILKKQLNKKLHIYYDFDQTKTVHHFLNMYEAQITDNLFDEKPIIECLVKPKNIEDLKLELKEASNATIKTKEYSEIILT